MHAVSHRARGQRERGRQRRESEETRGREREWERERKAERERERERARERDGRDWREERQEMMLLLQSVPQILHLSLSHPSWLCMRSLGLSVRLCVRTV
jgi:hypothetical protein